MIMFFLLPLKVPVYLPLYSIIVVSYLILNFGDCSDNCTTSTFQELTVFLLLTRSGGFGGVLVLIASQPTSDPCSEYHFRLCFLEPSAKTKTNKRKTGSEINICMQNTDTQDGVKKIVQRYITGRTRIYHIFRAMQSNM